MNTEKILVNEYFNFMKNTAIAYDAQVKMIDEQMRKVARVIGYDSSEMAMLKEMRKSVKDEFSRGEWMAYHAWQNTVCNDRGAEKVILKDGLFDNDVAGFVHALRTAEQTTFIYASESTAVMRNIQSFIAAGCKMLGTVSWEEKEVFGTKTAYGIEFEL